MLRSRLRAVLVFLVPLAVYNVGFRYLASGDTAPAELLPISLLTEGDFDLDEFVGHELPYWSRVRNGRVVSYYPVLPGVLNLPVYSAARLLGVDLYAQRFRLSMLTASFLSALSVLVMYLCLRRIVSSEAVALFLAFVYAFATCVWSVCSRGLFQHGPSLLLLSLAFLLLLSSGRRAQAFAGLLLGLAVINRPTNILIALPLALFVFRTSRRVFPSFAGLALLPAALHALYAFHYWGNALSPPQPASAGDFSGNIVIGVAGLLVSPSRGLFVFSPVFLFALPAAVRVFRAQPGETVKLLRYLTVSAVLVLLLYSSWGAWWGGHTFAYRIIVEIVPILTLLLAFGWREGFGGPPRVAAFLACLAFSVYVHFLGAMVVPSSFNENLERETHRLWDVRNSEIALSTKILLRRLGFPIPAEASRGIGGVGEAPPAPIPAWWTVATNDYTIPGWLDGPRDGQLVRGPLRIEGWAKSPNGEVEVRVSMSPGPVEVPLERFPRPDLSRALPALGDASRAGFRAILKPTLGGLRQYALIVEMRAPNGGVRLHGPIRFRWGL